jgi:hypothetical protein
LFDNHSPKNSYKKITLEERKKGEREIYMELAMDGIDARSMADGPKEERAKNRGCLRYHLEEVMCSASVHLYGGRSIAWY